MPNNIPEPLKRWNIGIDFGTTNTYIVAYDESEDKVYTNESRLNKSDTADKFHNIPTAITIDLIGKAEGTEPEEKILVGNQAIQKCWLRIFRDLKTAARTLTPPNGKFGEGEKAVEYPFRNCDLETSLQFGTDEYPIKKRVEDLLREYFKQIFRLFGIDPKEVKSLVVGHPAVNGRDGTRYNYKDILQTTFDAIFESEATVEILPEPVLAGITYLFGDDLSRETTTVLVIDIGGGTTDFSILPYHKDGEIGKGVTDSCNVAGNAIDEFIMKLLPEDCHANKIVCRRAKEQFFAEGVGNLEYSGKHLSLMYDSPADNAVRESNYISLKEGALYINGEKKRTLKNGGIEQGIEQQVFEKIWEKLDRVLRAHDGSPINNVFFVGGSSAIDQLREYLVARMRRHHSKKLDGNVVYETLSDDSRRVAVPGGEAITVTQYNAVAIGAFIKAIDYQCIVKPEITFQWKGIFQKAQTAVSVRNILLVGNEYVESAFVVGPQEQRWFNKFRDLIERHNVIEWTVKKEKEEPVVYRFQTNIKELGECLSNGEKGMLIVLSLNKEGARCVLYGCTRPHLSTMKEYIESNGIDKARDQDGNKAQEYELKKMEGKNE